METRGTRTGPDWRDHPGRSRDPLPMNRRVRYEEMKDIDHHDDREERERDVCDTAPWRMIVCLGLTQPLPRQHYYTTKEKSKIREIHGMDGQETRAEQLPEFSELSEPTSSCLSPFLRWAVLLTHRFRLIFVQRILISRTRLKKMRWKKQDRKEEGVEDRGRREK